MCRSMVFSDSIQPFGQIIKCGLEKQRLTLAQYLKAIEKELAGGRATEHTHRPALKTLVESLGNGRPAKAARNKGASGSIVSNTSKACRLSFGISTLAAIRCWKNGSRIVKAASSLTTTSRITNTSFPH